MARRIPAAPQPPARPPGSRYQVEQYSFSLVTPLFGGGVQAGEPDARQPIRASSIRGHLRFWWRATVGAQYETVQDLREREAAVWGDTESPSKVSVSVVSTKIEALRACATWSEQGNSPTWNAPFSQRYKHKGKDKPSPLPYVLFPFQGDSLSRRASSYVPAGSSFVLEVRWPREFSDDVHAALSAWVMFGGLGARTRRGCGAMFSPQWSPSLNSRNQLELRPTSFQVSQAVRQWPTLSRDVICRNVPANPLECWQFVAYYLRDMRQGIGLGRDGREGRGRDSTTFRRSFWPEAETIRLSTGQRFRPHVRDEKIPNAAVPRAAFGLPINTTFKPGQGDREATGRHDLDPRPTAWVPKIDEAIYQRWASPLILKPLATSPSHAVPLLAVLNGPRVSHVALVAGNHAIQVFGPDQIRNPKFADYEDSPLFGVPESGDALKAFVAMFVENCDEHARRLFP